MFDYVVFCSFGNDSIALLQWAKQEKLERVAVVYTDTRWGSEDWPARVEKGKKWATEELGYRVFCIRTEGLKNLAIGEKGFPSFTRRWCTRNLKQIPAKKWLDATDPTRDAVCMVGIRREESRSRRGWPEWVESSEKHGGRSLWAPLVRFRERDRDALIRKAGWEVYPDRSRECYPCVFAGKATLSALPESRIQEVEKLESLVRDLSGKDSYLFDPAGKRGAKGIRQVVDWAKSGRGEYEPPAPGCDSGFCYEV